MVGLDYDKSEDDWLVYGTNMFAALTILVKDCLMLWNIGKAYLESTSAVIEMIAVTVLIAIDIDTIVQHDNRLFILWSTLCVIFTINLIIYLKKTKIFHNNIQILILAIKNMYPFLFVVIMSYVLFAFVGIALFGGKIHSGTPEVYLKATGSQLNRMYQHLNWNDMGNAIAFLYTVQIGNQIPILVNLSACGRHENYRDYSGLFFFAFIVINEMILFNLFIGNLIAISLNFLQLEKVAKELKEDKTEYSKFLAGSVLLRKLNTTN